MNRTWWMIKIGGEHGYGSFPWYGTEGEAEEMRVHKSNWEGERGIKWQIPDDHPGIGKFVRDNAARWRQSGMKLDDREQEMIDKYFKTGAA